MDLKKSIILLAEFIFWSVGSGDILISN